MTSTWLIDLAVLTNNLFPPKRCHQMDIIRILNDIGKQVYKHHDRINCGGCCVFAARVAECLRDVGVDDVCLWVSSHSADSDADAINNARNNAKATTVDDWHREGVSFAHVIVGFAHNGKTWQYDTHGVFPLDNCDAWDRPLYKDAMTIEEGIVMANQVSGWNDSFNRAEIPAVHQIINSHFGIRR